MAIFEIAEVLLRFIIEGSKGYKKKLLSIGFYGLFARDPEGIAFPFGSEFRDKKVQEFHSCFLFVFIRPQVNLAEFHQTKSPQLSLRTFLSLRDPEGIRTPDRLLRRQMLYPTELRDQSCVKKERQPSCLFFVGVAGFEPTTSCSQSRRDTGLRYTPKCSLAP
ncbi:MAG: hypothetical protein RLZZ91_1484 [Bacteroidota bacterium]